MNEYREMEWNFNGESSVFMGFEVWQTANEIRSISVLTMDLGCVRQKEATAHQTHTDEATTSTEDA